VGARGGACYVAGDAVNDGLVMLLATMGLRANNEGLP
jgi:hypothetical protein